MACIARTYQAQLPNAPATIQRLQEQAPGSAFDFVKLDVEGEENFILRDPASMDVLCEARCVIIEIHEKIAPGATHAWKNFLYNGCAAGGGNRLGRVGTFGKYHMYCRNYLIWAA